ncbi:hypothetical protein AVEN_206805-1 [Araneus ventricosus]|uniref:Uncharacterized protein n=1 Tax=Araneus ventricosus TaxID=182803 RepID=A0A4Y2C4X5_ARAVE|nr:hypothetical protein AVEN_206805-1 [Araneus ventricosus]
MENSEIKSNNINETKICPFFSKDEPGTTPETDQIAHVVEEVVDLITHLHLKVDRNDVNELFDSQSENLTVDILIEMRQHIATREANTSYPYTTEK